VSKLMVMRSPARTIRKELAPAQNDPVLVVLIASWFRLSGISVRRLVQRWPEQNRVVDDEPKFVLGIANVALLPEARILRPQPEDFQRSLGRAVLKPDVELIAIGNCM
jgi:hypothetical protein